MIRFLQGRWGSELKIYKICKGGSSKKKTAIRFYDPQEKEFIVPDFDIVILIGGTNIDNFMGYLQSKYLRKIFSSLVSQYGDKLKDAKINSP